MADQLDLLSPDEARSALNIQATDPTQDDELGGFITAVSRRIDAMCGPVVIRTVTGEAHDGGGPAIRVYEAPVATVSTVTEYAGGTATVLTAENPVAVATTDYYLDRYAGAIYRRSGGNDAFFPPGRGVVVVTYEAGRYADTATVDSRFKQAAAIFLAHLWRYEQGQGTATFGAPSEGLGIPTFGTPNAVRDLLVDQLKGPACA